MVAFWSDVTLSKGGGRGLTGGQREPAFEVLKLAFIART
jgi:hypothetical protein